MVVGLRIVKGRSSLPLCCSSRDVTIPEPARLSIHQFREKKRFTGTYRPALSIVQYNSGLVEDVMRLSDDRYLDSPNPEHPVQGEGLCKVSTLASASKWATSRRGSRHPVVNDVQE